MTYIKYIYDNSGLFSICDIKMTVSYENCMKTRWTYHHYRYT